jgi:hypothetical protein
MLNTSKVKATTPEAHDENMQHQQFEKLHCHSPEPPLDIIP